MCPSPAWRRACALKTAGNTCALGPVAVSQAVTPRARPRGAGPAPAARAQATLQRGPIPGGWGLPEGKEKEPLLPSKQKMLLFHQSHPKGQRVLTRSLEKGLRAPRGARAPAWPSSSWRTPCQARSPTGGAAELRAPRFPGSGRREPGPGNGGAGAGGRSQGPQGCPSEHRGQP